MPTIKFVYKNHRGEIKQRTVDVLSFDYNPNPGFGYEPGWFITGFCHDKKAMRSFALENIVLHKTLDFGAIKLRNGLYRIVVDEHMYSNLFPSVNADPDIKD